jgi:hypothetical protein
MAMEHLFFPQTLLIYTKIVFILQRKKKSGPWKAAEPRDHWFLLSVLSHQPSAISHQPSAISHQPSAEGQVSAFPLSRPVESSGYSTGVSYQLSVIRALRQIRS